MIANLKINNKKIIVALKLGEEEFQFNFSKFKNQPYEKEVDTKENDLLPCLAIIYGETPQDALERSLTNNEGICNDERKMYYDTHLNISLAGDKYNLHSAEKPCKQDGDDCPIELQTLPSDLKYIYLNDTINHPVIINAYIS